MKYRIILKGAVALLIALAMVFSSVDVTADTVENFIKIRIIDWRTQ